jgi:hypothetical protein
MPALVAAASAPPQLLARLHAGFAAAATRPWFAALAEPLLLEGFAPVNEDSYALLLEWDRAARAAGYERPA